MPFRKDINREAITKGEHRAPMSEPRLLVLETSGRLGEVALCCGAILLGQAPLSHGRKHARDLVPAAHSLLQHHQLAARDLNGVIVGIGPGSYTGLRVGVMSAKAMAYALDCPVIGVETFLGLAAQVPPEVGLVDVLSDAQQERVYVQSFQREEDAWRPKHDLVIRPLREWLADRDPEAWATGPGVSTYQDLLPSDLRLVEQSARAPTAKALHAIGLKRYLQGDHSDLWGLEPLYLRPSAAEEQWDRRIAQKDSTK